MTQEDAEQIADWRYEPPYDFYERARTSPSSCSCSTRPVAENRTFSARDETRRARRLLHVRTRRATRIVVGLGLRPDLTGHGPRHRVRRAGTRVRRATDMRRSCFRLDVAEFNERAVKVYERVGLRAHAVVPAADERRLVPVRRDGTAGVNELIEVSDEVREALDEGRARRRARDDARGARLPRSGRRRGRARERGGRARGGRGPGDDRRPRRPHPGRPHGGRARALHPDARKLGPRDLARLRGRRATSARRPSAALLTVARAVGIRFMGTGGIGGVHRGFPSPPDVSADLLALVESPVLVIVLGREVAPRRPRDHGVPGDARHPGRSATGPTRCRSSTRATGGPPVPQRVEDGGDRGAHRRRPLAARRLRAPAREPAAREHRRRGPDRGGVAEAARQGVAGQAVTPFVLAFLHERSGGTHARGEPRADRRQRAARRRGRGSVRRPVSLYDRVRDLPLEIEGYELEGLELQARADFLRKTTVVHLQGGGEEGIGEDVTYHGEEHDRAAGTRRRPAARRRVDAAHVLASTSRRSRSSRRSRRSTRTSTTGAGRSRAPRSTSRSARRECRSATRSARRARPVSFVVSMGLGDASVDRALPRLARALPAPALQARRERRLDGRARRRAAGHGRDRLDRPQGPVPRARSSTRRPTRISTAASPRGCPRRGSRTRRSPTRRCPCSSRTATA